MDTNGQKCGPVPWDTMATWWQEKKFRAETRVKPDGWFDFHEIRTLYDLKVGSQAFRDSPVWPDVELNYDDAKHPNPFKLWWSCRERADVAQIFGKDLCAAVTSALRPPSKYISSPEASRKEYRYDG